MAAREPAFRMAIPPLQFPELAHQGRIQERRVSDASLDEHEDERPGCISVHVPLLPDLYWALVVPDYGLGVPCYEQRC